jgi:hypothetical protein
VSEPIFVSARWLPYFVSPDDVRDKKRRIEAMLAGLDAAIAACVAIGAIDRQRWALFLAGWAAFRDGEDSWLHTASQNEQADAYETDGRAWAEWFGRQACAATSSAPSISTWGERPDADGESAHETKSTVKTVAIAGAVIAIALGLRAMKNA